MTEPGKKAALAGLGGNPWLHSAVIVAPSPIAGHGLFATDTLERAWRLVRRIADAGV